MYILSSWVQVPTQIPRPLLSLYTMHSAYPWNCPTLVQFSGPIQQCLITLTIQWLGSVPVSFSITWSLSWSEVISLGHSCSVPQWFLDVLFWLSLVSSLAMYTWVRSLYSVTVLSPIPQKFMSSSHSFPSFWPWLSICPYLDLQGLPESECSWVSELCLNFPPVWAYKWYFLIQSMTILGHWSGCVSSI